MRIFLSWSGDQSRMFAESLKPWLEVVLSGSDVWLSSEDIDKGDIWFSDIIDKLNGCDCGVICLTMDNRLSPWIHFEAGGLVKGLGKRRVAIILLDLEISDLRQPLNLFNALRLNRQGAWHLVKSLAGVSKDRPYKDHVLERTFEKFWPDLEKEYQTQFPNSHRAARDVEQPLYIAPDPAKPPTIIGDPESKKQRRKDRKSDDAAAEKQARLFNGGTE